MPNAIPSWTTSDGKVWTNYVTSLKHELFLWLSKAGENEVGARRIVDSLKPDTITPLVDLLEKIEEEFDDPTNFTVIRNTKPDLTQGVSFTLRLPDAG